MRGWKQRKVGGLFPLPFRSLTFSFSSYFKSVQSLTLGVPYFTTNQQHGIPFFINEDPPRLASRDPCVRCKGACPRDNGQDQEGREDEEECPSPKE
jgi:hypothetical protein